MKPGSALAKLKALAKERNLLLWGGLATAGGTAAMSVLSLVFGRRETARALHLLLGVAALFAASLGAWFECPTPAACSPVSRRKVDSYQLAGHREDLQPVVGFTCDCSQSRILWPWGGVSCQPVSFQNPTRHLFESNSARAIKTGHRTEETCTGRGFESNLSLFHCRTACLAVHRAFFLLTCPCALLLLVSPRYSDSYQ